MHRLNASSRFTQLDMAIRNAVGVLLVNADRIDDPSTADAWRSCAHSLEAAWLQFEPAVDIEGITVDEPMERPALNS